MHKLRPVSMRKESKELIRGKQKTQCVQPFVHFSMHRRPIEMTRRNFKEIWQQKLSHMKEHLKLCNNLFYTYFIFFYIVSEECMTFKQEQ